MTARTTPLFSVGIALICAALAACSRREQAAPSLPAAAIVDQVVVSRQVVDAAAPPDDQARRGAALESIVAEQLLANAAVKEKLEDDPVNRAAMETARRQVLARAYVRKKSASIAAPTPVEVAAYYNAHPELFARRRIYRFQEIGVSATPEQLKQLGERFLHLNTFNERIAELKKLNIRYTTGAAVKPAEEIQADLLHTVTQLHDGDSFTVPGTGGAAFVQITGIEAQAVTEEQARPTIERYLTNQRLGKLINVETKRLRSAAKIEYVAPYAPPAA